MGYDVERFVGYVNEGLLCCVCRDVLEDPVQAPCEHAFCSACIHGWLLQHQTCPEDRLPLNITHLHPLFRYMRNDLLRLQVGCLYRPQGCEMICSLEAIQRHERDCDYSLLGCSNAGGEYLCYRCGCPVQVSRRSLEAHLCVCEFRSRVCPSGCGFTILSSDDAPHNCISELRSELDLLRAELDCKFEEVRREMVSRLDSQRRHMVQKESQLKSEVEELRGQLSRVMSDVRVLLGAEQARRQELERAELEKAELLELVKSLQKEVPRTVTPTQREGSRTATPSPPVTHPAGEGPCKPSPRGLVLDCIKRKNREVTVI